MRRVEGKVALVTGAASGLGAADAKRLAEEGAMVVLTDVNAALGHETAASIPGAVFLEHDVRDEARWRAVVAETVERFGELHILVNNAGLVRFGTVEDCTLDDFRLHQQVMVEGSFLGCKYGVPAIANSGGGSIINVSSVSGLKGAAVLTAYSAAKAAIIGMTRSIAVHCQERGYGIRVNTIAPGGHDTPMTRQAIARMSPEDAALRHVQAMGMGQPVDVANLVLFLASDEARQITGTVLVIDNGETMN